MHGVPPDLPLASFVGHECNQIALGESQIQFHFAGAGSIFVESRWELRDSAGSVVDGSCEHAERACFRIHKIISVPVTAYSINAPHSFALHFESGLSLTIFDESQHYESFSAQLGDGQSFYV